MNKPGAVEAERLTPKEIAWGIGAFLLFTAIVFGTPAMIFFVMSRPSGQPTQHSTEVSTSFIPNADVSATPVHTWSTSDDKADDEADDEDSPSDSSVADDSPAYEPNHQEVDDPYKTGQGLAIFLASRGQAINELSCVTGVTAMQIVDGVDYGSAQDDIVQGCVDSAN